MAIAAYYTLFPLAYLLYSCIIVVYRLCFHPLAKFPGPKIAAATAWYETYHDLKTPGGQFMYKLQQLHIIYGPIVRISPHEVHINDTHWTDALLVSSVHGLRDKYTPAAHQAGTPEGVFGTAAHHIHRRRRAALNPLFSKSCATAAEPMIYDKANLLLQTIDRQIARDGWSEMRTTFLAFASDVASTYSFGQTFGLLEDENKAQDWHQSIRALAKTIPLARQFSWIISLSTQVPVSLIKTMSPQLAKVAGMHHDMMAQALTAVREHDNEKMTTGQSYSRTPGERLAIFRTVLSNEGLPPHEKVFSRISHEGVTIMAAGGETTASNLMAAIYFILSDKERILPKIRTEIQSIMPSEDSRPSTADFESLPWLTAVIKETLRITTLTARLTRVAPIEPLHYGRWVMPPGTAVSVTLRNVSLDPEIFPEPMEFRPERWLPTNPDLDRCNHYLVPFSRGSRMCLGLNLAYAELYIALAMMFRHKDYELFETVRERDVDFVRDFFVGETSANTKGVRIRYASLSA